MDAKVSSMWEDEIVDGKWSLYQTSRKRNEELTAYAVMVDYKSAFS